MADLNLASGGVPNAATSNGFVIHIIAHSEQVMGAVLSGLELCFDDSNVRDVGFTILLIEKCFMITISANIIGYSEFLIAEVCGNLKEINVPSLCVIGWALPQIVNQTSLCEKQCMTEKRANADENNTSFSPLLGQEVVQKHALGH